MHVTEAAVPITHISLWVQVIAVFVTFCGLCGSAGWVGAKLAMKAFYAEISGINERLAEIVDSQKELRRNTLIKLADSIAAKVPKERCDEERGACSTIRTQSFCEMAKHVQRLTLSVEVLNEKREQTKDELHSMFTAIMEKITDIEKQAIARRVRHQDEDPVPGLY